MKSIKPGRGPSAMGALGSIIAVIFGIFWTIIAFSITRGVPGIIGLIFPLFGILFIVTGIVQTVFHFKNATGRNRMSYFDIVDSSREPDPLDDFVNRPFGSSTQSNRFGDDSTRFESRNAGTPEASRESGTTASTGKRKYQGEYCPFCGGKLEEEFLFCPHCGKEI
ncbi:zinc ribbon domain-containing protein [Gorillibacterium timonense]|uniref:zinc ribbon domain-containing protein n=1 Tax=Gorillibacterium timonense TaxID=1689269 RepID=UPI00071C3B9A|nr:zinc ribbon domain-containing protein [Gorillibacterium timonense]